MNETPIMKQVMLVLGQHESLKIFRNNVGMGWIGESRKLPTGSVLIKNPRPLHAGLCKGSSDLIGWKEVVITPEMVGKKVAIFTAVEVKKTKGARVSPEQVNFLKVVQEAGGNAFIVQSPEQAEQLFKL